MTGPVQTNRKTAGLGPAVSSSDRTEPIPSIEKYLSYRL